jgi:hypothetical protein
MIQWSKGELVVEQSQVFFDPTPSISHANGNEIDERAVRWVIDSKLCAPDSPVTRINVGEFIAQCYPYCRDMEILGIAADLNYLGFAFDDAHVTDPELRTCSGLAPAVGRLLAVLDSPEAQDHSVYGAALQDIFRRLTDATNGANVAHVADGLRKALLYTLWHMSNWERGVLPDLNSYVTLRINDCGGPWFNAFVPVCGGYELTAQEARTPRVRAISQAIALAAGIDNDIFSFSREDAVGQKNIVHILMNDGGISLDEAMSEAVQLRSVILYLYERLRDRSQSDESPAVRQYARDIGHVVRGNFQWSVRTDRYGVGTRTLPTRTSDSRDIDPKPIPLPAIAWWWDLL